MTVIGQFVGPSVCILLWCCPVALLLCRASSLSPFSFLPPPLSHHTDLRSFLTIGCYYRANRSPQKQIAIFGTKRLKHTKRLLHCTAAYAIIYKLVVCVFCLSVCLPICLAVCQGAVRSSVGPSIYRMKLAVSQFPGQFWLSSSSI